MRNRWNLDNSSVSVVQPLTLSPTIQSATWHSFTALFFFQCWFWNGKDLSRFHLIGHIRKVQVVTFNNIMFRESSSIVCVYVHVYTCVCVYDCLSGAAYLSLRGINLKTFTDYSVSSSAHRLYVILNILFYPLLWFKFLSIKIIHY